jgi:uncharacterized membrane protein
MAIKPATHRRVTAVRPDQLKTESPSSGGIQIERTLTVLAPIERVYREWRNFERLPLFMHHLITVRDVEEVRSIWVVKAPGGKTVEWQAELIEDKPNERISWRTLEGSDIDHAGSVRFRPAPSDRGTEITVMLSYNPPAGTTGEWIARMFGEEPEVQIADDFRRFKALIETGEIPTSAMRPRGDEVSGEDQ